MSDYNRLISYIYAYENGVKTRNSGFAKVETRGGICKFSISLKIHEILMNETEDNMLEVFVFTRKEGHVYKSKIGRIRIMNGSSVFRAQFKTENMGDAGFALEEVAGIFICSRAFLKGRSSLKKVYASEWDDTTIYVEEFEETEVTLPEEQELSESEKRQQEETAAEISVAEIAKETQQIMPNPSLPNPSLPNPSLPNPSLPNPSLPNPSLTEANMPVTVMKEEEIPQEIQQSQSVSDVMTVPSKNVEVSQSKESGSSDKMRREPLDIEEEPEKQMENYEKQLQKLLEKSDNNIGRPRLPQNSDYFRMLSNCYPTVKVEGLGNCLKITPHDISYLPKKYWHLCNNSFLLNAYCHFRYILLCEESPEETGDEYQYMICVPGFFRSRDRNVARMYGFNRFTEKEKNGSEKFGYWCMVL